VDFLFGCQQCRPPGPTDLAILATAVWALLTFSIVLLAAWAQQRKP